MTRSIGVVLSRRQRNDSLDAGSTVASMGPMRIVMVGFIACFGLGCGSDPLPGRDGTQGLPGRDGVQGPDGTLGAAGVAGPQGAVGAVGPAGNPGLGGPVDGSRLKAMYRKGTDGSREYVPGKWWDSTLQVECSYQRASDGVERCLPILLNVVAASQFSYLDAACTQLAVAYLAPAQGCPPEIISIYVSIVDPSCGVYARAYAVAPPVDSATPIYNKAGGSCFGGGPLGVAGFVQPIGAEVPAASFVDAMSMHD